MYMNEFSTLRHIQTKEQPCSLKFSHDLAAFKIFNFCNEKNVLKNGIQFFLDDFLRVNEKNYYISKIGENGEFCNFMHVSHFMRKYALGIESVF